MQLADLAFKFGDDPDAQISQSLLQPSDVFLAPRQPVECFAAQHIETVYHGLPLHLVKTWP
jgi:hypothetical protein